MNRTNLLVLAAICLFLSPLAASAQTIPTTCFGRTVEYTANGGIGSPGRTSGMKPGVMKLIRIKTGAAGTNNVMQWITYAQVEGTTIGFISTTPCDFTEAYNNNLAVGGREAGGWGFGGAPNLPTLAENQVQAYFDMPANHPAASELLPANLVNTFGNLPAYRKAYLKPNTYYYLSVVNSSTLIEGSDTQFVKINADLAGTHDSCLTSYAQARGGTCTYEYFDYMNMGDSTIPGLPAPTTGGGTAPVCTTTTAPPVADTSTCKLPNGSTLAGGNYSNTATLSYQATNSNNNQPACYSASFYCSQGVLTYGLQFSPAPPQPTVGATLYDGMSCSSSLTTIYSPVVTSPPTSTTSCVTSPPPPPPATSPATASGLTQTQITAIIGLLQAFNADQSIINNVQNALNGAQTTQTQQTINQTTQTTSTSLTAPAITSVSPSIITAGQPITLILSGSNFKSGATVSYTGTGSGSVPTTFYSPNLLSFGPFSFNFGAYTFSIRNPDGQVSQSSASVMVKSSSLASTGTPIGGSTATTITTTTCPAVTCSGAYPLKDTSINQCYAWSGGSCANKCLSAGNCLYPSYASGACSCVYPVDFSPAYSEACAGSPQKTYQPGQASCTPTTTTTGGGTSSGTTGGNATCDAPTGWSCSTSPLTFATYGGVYAGVPFDINSGHTFAFSAPPNVVYVHPIKFDPAVYTLPSAGLIESEFTVNAGPRQAVISTIPGSMDPVGSNVYCDSRGGAIVFTFYISFNAAPGKCSLDKNKQYYLNMKSLYPDQPIDYLLVSSAQP